MNNYLDGKVLWTLAGRTFRQAVESPIAYVVAIFFYGFVGAFFGSNYFAGGQASAAGVAMSAPWVLWFVVPALTMGLISEELRSGTFEQMSTLPVRDWEIVLGKYAGFAMLAFLMVAGLTFFPVVVGLTAMPKLPSNLGGNVGMLASLFMVCLTYGAIGLFASSLAKNQVVALIIGMIFCTALFFIGQFAELFPGALARAADFAGITSHLQTLSRGVWDVRDFIYFLSVIIVFLYFTVQRLTTRRF